MSKEWKVIYDLTSTPMGWELEDVLRVSEETGIILWDSHNKGSEPKLVDDNVELEVIDINNAEE